MIQIKQGSTVLHKVKEFTFQEGEMSDATITLNLQLPASTAPNFAKDMYVEYLGEKFYLTNTKPQGVKDISSVLYTYSLIFDSERSELKRRMVRDLATIGNDTYVSQGLIFSLNLTLAEFFALIQRNLTDCFGDKWVVDIYSGLSQPNSVKIDVSNTYIWDLMLKTYEFYGVRWTITSTGDALYIAVGYPAQEVGHQFEYGSTTGLTKITRETSNDKIINRLRGTGGTRNVPVNYFTDRYSEFTPDPNPIPGFLSFKNIMPKCFRDSIIARIEYTDYVEDSALVTQYGVIEDGLEPNEDIYPSIEGVTITGLGRIDEIVSAEIIESDDKGTEGDSAVASIDSVATVPYVIPETGTRGTSTNTKTTTVDTANFTIAEQCITAKFNLQYIDQLENSHMPTGSYVFKTKDGKEITITGEPTTLSATVLLMKVSDNSVVSTFNFTKVDVSITKELVCKNLVPGEYKFRVTSYATGALAADSRSLTWSAKASLYNIMNSKGIYKTTFDIWVKDIQFDLRETNQDGTPKYASLDEAKIAFKSGALAGYEFVILQVGGQFAVTLDTSRSLSGVPSKYKITLIKSEEEVKASGMLIPNTSVHAYPTSADLLPTYGDKFVILDIQMPQSYIENAEQRVQDYLEAQLDILKVVEPTYTMELLDSFLAENPAIAGDIRAGNIVTIADSVLIGGSASLYINSVTISKKDLLPKYTVTVTNKRTVNGSTVQRIQAQIDSLYTGQYSSAQSLETSILSLKNKFLQKNVEDVAFEKVTFKKGAVVSRVETDNFSQGQFGGSGGAMYKDSDGSSVIEIDRLRVRKEAVFNELVINQIKFQGGIVVYSAANMEVSRVEKIGNDYRLYFDTKGGTVHNQFVEHDIIRCQRFSYTNGESKYYSTIVTDLGSDFIHISDYSKNPTCTLNPEVGDQIVQFGHISDVNRQSIIEVDVLNGGRQTFYQKVSTYDLTNKNYIDLGMVYKDGVWKNMIRAFGNAYIGARDESSYIKFEEDGTMDIRANVSFKSPVAGGGFEYKDIPIALEEAVDNIQIGGRNYLIDSRMDTINQWNANGGSFEVVSDNKFGSVIEYTRLSGGGDFQRQFSIEYNLLKNTDVVYYAIVKDINGTGGWNFGGWVETYNSLNNTCDFIELGDGWKLYYKVLNVPQLSNGLAFGLNSIGGIWRFHSFGVCKGNKPPLDWTAAPEDITANIAAAQQAAIDEIEQYAAIIDSNMADFQAQLDGVVDSYFHEYSPLTTNEPWATWLAATDPTAEQNNHIGDTFTNITEFVDVETTPDAGKSWRFIVDENGFRWVRIQDSEAAAALLAASAAQDTADGKRRVFVATPTVPYDIGDLWAGGTSGELKKCIVAKSISGTYSASDWGLATKYTDDTAANAAQTAANNAASAASAASTAASNAQTSANGANALLTDIADDNKLTPLDKQLAKKEWDVITSEKSKIDAQADVYVVSKTAYGTAYTNLNTYLNTTITSPNTTALLASLSTTSVIVGSDFRAIFKAYYDARQDVLNAISTATKTYATTIVNDIKIGGANLYDKTDIPVKMTTGGAIEKISDYEWKFTGDQHVLPTVFRIPNVITENGWWTVSFDLRGSQSVAIGIDVDICDNAAGNASTTNDNTYKRVSFSVKVENYTAELHNFIDISCNNWAWYYIRNVQLEKGNKATDYKLSDNDVKSSIADAKLAGTNAQSSANAANQAVTSLNTYVDSSFKDGVIDAAEAKAIEKYINSINTEYDNVINSYTVVYANSYLTGTSKANLLSAKITLAGHKDALITAINTAISDGKTTATEKATVDAAYATYKSSFASYSTALENANKAIQQELDRLSGQKVADIVIGGANLLHGSTVGTGWGENHGSGAHSVVTVIGRSWMNIAAQSNACYFWLAIDIAEPNIEYTFSFDLLGTTPVEINFSYQFAQTYNAGSSTVPLRVRKTFKWTAEPAYRVVYFVIPTNGWSNLISNVQLEKGNKATDWRPSKTDVDATAEAYAIAKASLAEITAKAHADGIVSAEEARAIADATAKANAAKELAISTAAADATSKANAAQAAAEDYALAKAELAETTAKAHADGIVSAEEARAIADATAKANAAKELAISTAAADATTKSNNALNSALEYGTGKNLFPQAEFANGLDDWTYGVSLSSLQVSGKGVNLNADWSLNGNTNLRNNQGLNTIFMTHGNWVDEDGDYAYLVSQPIKGIQGGKKYIISAYVANHRAINVSMYIEFYNSNGSWLNYSGMPATAICGANEADGGKNINGYKRIYAVVTAHQDAVSANIVFRKYGTIDSSPASADSYMFVCRPMLEQVAEQTTKPGAWTPYASGAEVAESKALLADIASDSKFTPSEKQSVKKEWSAIQDQYAAIKYQCLSLQLNDLDNDTFADFEDGYSALSTYIVPLLTDVNTTSDIISSIFIAKFRNCYAGFEAQRGQITTTLKAKADASKYIQDAIKGTTDVNGGLLSTHLIRMKDAANAINGGMSGLSDNVGFWTGGTYEQALTDSASAFKSAKLTGALDRKDGAGHRAKGNFAWDAAGNVFFKGVLEALSGGKVGDFSIVGENLISKELKFSAENIPDITYFYAPYGQSIPYNASQNTNTSYSYTQPFEVLDYTKPLVTIFTSSNGTSKSWRCWITNSNNQTVFEKTGTGEAFSVNIQNDIGYLSPNTYQIHLQAFATGGTTFATNIDGSGANNEILTLINLAKTTIAKNGLAVYIDGGKHLYFSESLFEVQVSNAHGIRINSSGVYKKVGANWTLVNW